MKHARLIVAASALAALTATARVTAQDTNASERTFLTFSGAVEMPGMTLEPGTYVFKLADTPSRNVVQVWDRDDKKMFGQWLFVQAERPEVTEENVVMFKEARENSTPAVQFWYYPGEKVGKEFIYPKEQAQRIAARTGRDVRSENGVIEGSGVPPVTAAAQPAAEAPVNGPGNGSAAGATAQAQAESPAPPQAAASAAPAAPAARAEVAAASPAPAQAPRPVGTSGAAEAQVARAELPRTASPMALFALIGVLSLAGAMGVRAIRA
jgi:cobalamin biosynthesis Mg chelatase CobN